MDNKQGPTVADRQEAARLARMIDAQRTTPPPCVVLGSDDWNYIIAALRAFAGQDQRAGAACAQAGNDVRNDASQVAPDQATAAQSLAHPSTAAQVPAQPQSGAPSQVQHPEPAPAVDRYGPCHCEPYSQCRYNDSGPLCEPWQNPPEQVPVTQAGAEDAKLPAAGRASAATTVMRAIYSPDWSVSADIALPIAYELDACRARLAEAQREVATLLAALKHERDALYLVRERNRNGDLCQIRVADIELGIRQLDAAIDAARGKP